MTSEWLIERDSYDPAEDGFYESLFALANGNIGVRATVDFETGGGYPGFFHSRIYGPSVTETSQIVNLFNPTFRSVAVRGVSVPICRGNLVSFSQTLDLELAEQRIEAILRFSDRRIAVRAVTVIPATREEIIVCRIEVTALDDDLDVIVTCGLDWSAGNRDYGGIFDRVKVHHLEVRDRSWAPGRLSASFDNVGSGEVIDSATSILGAARARREVALRSRHAEAVMLTAERGQPVRIDSVTAVTVRRHPRVERSADEVLRIVLEPGLEALLADHRAVWARRWTDAASVEGPADLRIGVRFSQFHALQAVSRFADEVAVPARGLTSEYHSGHHFFNTELFLLPYFSWTEPNVARALLQHRVSTLSSARRYATATGFIGARYPSAADLCGNLAAPTEVNDVFSGRRWLNLSAREIVHNSGHVIYAIDEYLRASGDRDFVVSSCANVIIECARFLADLMRWDDSVHGRGCKAVTGPNEYHHGVDHHFGTNLLARWGLMWAAQFAAESDALSGLVEAEEVATWLSVANQIYLPQARSQVYPAFEGYFNLPDRTRGTGKGSSGVPGEPTGADQVTKQCDVVLAMLLCRTWFGQEGFKDALEANMAYYEPRTEHGSSLSVVHSAIAAFEIGDDVTGLQLLTAAARYNLAYRPTIHYTNGVHLPACAGTWLILVYGCLGLKTEGKRLILRPRLPEEIRSLTAPIRFIGARVVVSVMDTSRDTRRVRTVEVASDASNTSSIPVHIYDRAVILRPGQRQRMTLSEETCAQ